MNRVIAFLVLFNLASGVWDVARECYGSASLEIGICVLLVAIEPARRP